MMTMMNQPSGIMAWAQPPPPPLPGSAREGPLETASAKPKPPKGGRPTKQQQNSPKKGRLSTYNRTTGPEFVGAVLDVLNPLPQRGVPHLDHELRVQHKVVHCRVGGREEKTHQLGLAEGWGVEPPQ